MYVQNLMFYVNFALLGAILQAFYTLDSRLWHTDAMKILALLLLAVASAPSSFAIVSEFVILTPSEKAVPPTAIEVEK